DEAVDLWKKVGAPNPAKKLGADTNFWNMGPTGPCGPCSEIYYDLGPEFASGQDDVVGGEGDRYIEIWNLVFTGFDRQPAGSLNPMVPAAIDIFAPGYPELRAASAQVQSIMKAEESNFLGTLNLGEAELKKALDKSGKTLSGDAAFRLYETFGFPLELTQEICAAQGVAVD